MKRNHCVVPANVVFSLVLLFAIQSATFAAAFVGTNTPGTGTDFSFTISAAATNLSLTVSNNDASAFSHLLLKKGGTPTDGDYDFIAQLDGAAAVTNAINLQLPELVAGTYGLRVRTPGNSAQHAFVVTFATNLTDMRTAARPVAKPQSSITAGSLANGEIHYFRVEIPASSPGWRLVLNSSGVGNGEIYVRKNLLPDTGSFDKRVVSSTNATIVFTDTELTTGGAYFIGVRANGGATSYTLYSEVGYLTTLTWDDGTTATGTSVLTNSNPSGGFFYFKIQTQNPSVGAWRTALKVLSGEADVFLKQGGLPAPDNYNYQSIRAGSDGMVLHSSQFAAGQDWFILVRATPGATWTLLSGEVFAYDLGPLAADASSGTNITILPEGMAFFKTTTTSDTLAWRLGLNGATNTLYVKKSFVPHPASAEQTQSRAMLLVEPYLAAGTFNGTFFVCVPGDPGTPLNLDSRKQPVTDISFGTSFNVVVATTNFPYVTYRVQVPVEQIAWQLNLTPTSGDGNLAMRRDKVPNEFQNDAFSDLPGAVGDSVTLVPPTLSDGTFYVTVYGGGAFTNGFSNGNPVITDVDYLFSITNDVPSRAGWRFYRVANIAEQLGTLGWNLFLSNQPAGTELALRRNAVPGRWNYRIADGNYNYNTLGSVDYSSTAGFLQRPGHQADIWYIGVYSATNALSNFVLTGSELTGQLISFDSGAGTSVSVTNQPAGQWKYFRIDVPTNTLGWDLRVVNVTGGSPQLVVRRDLLPDSVGTSFTPQGSPSWPTGARWAASGTDWTGYFNTPAGTDGHVQTLAMGMGNPLETGTYYVGVYDGSTASSYTLLSRGIGTGFAIPVRDLNYSGAGSSTNVTGLVAREAAYYRVVIASNTPSWKIKLTATSGESLIQVAKDFLPNVINGGYVISGGGGKRIQQDGNDHLTILPFEGEIDIRAGTYYLAVVSEGVGPVKNLSRIGTGSSDYTVASLGAAPVVNLGTLSSLDLLHTNTLESGELALYRFGVATNLQALEVRLGDRMGAPNFVLRAGDRLVQPNGFDFCENQCFEGGYYPTYADDDLLTLPNPSTNSYNFTVYAHATNCITANASFVTRIHRVTAGAVAFDGGTLSVTNQEPTSWRFYQVTVPTNAVGWDVRLLNISNGTPQLWIVRDLLPLPSIGTVAFNGINWPSGYQRQAGIDWTGYYYNSDGSVAKSTMLQMGMGNPLEPGTYFIGVYAPDGGSWTLQSRGIGAGFTIPVRDLNFAGAGSSTNVTGLVPREADYYRIVVPTNTPSWRLRLTNSVGDSLLLVQKDALPNVIAHPSGSPLIFSGGRLQKKDGDEQFTLLAQDGETNIPAGTYYLAVVGEGINPHTPQSLIGSNSVDYTIASLGTLPVINLGAVSGADLLHTNFLPAGTMAAYQFTVPSNTLSIELSVENTTGYPDMSVRMIDRIVGPVWANFGGAYIGSEGGQARTYNNQNLITISSPSNGLYSVSISAFSGNGNLDAGYTFRVHAVTVTEVTFDGGTSSVTNQNVGSWRYFHVTVPAGPLGWDVRLRNVSSNTPTMVVQRDTLPDVAGGNTFGRNTATTWPSGARWTVEGDWAGYFYGPDGLPARAVTLSVGMGNPLEPGSYYIGVYDGNGGSSYTLQSRGIGTNQSILVRDLSFSGTSGSTNITGLPVRDATYFRVTVPTNTPSWRVRLTPTSGEALLLINRGTIPNVISGGSISGDQNIGGKKNKQPGNEHFTLLAPDGETNIAAGTYFLGVVSEGVNASLPLNRYGSNSVNFNLASLGTLSVTNLGTLTSVDFVRANSLEGGAFASYLFTVPSNVLAMEVRLENITGLPAFNMRRIDRIVAPYWAVIYDCDYTGSEAGQARTFGPANLLTLANPTAGTYSLTVSATGNAGSCAGAFDADYTLRVRQIVPPNLNFSSELNTNGFTNVATGVLADNQRTYYRVVVPSNLGPATVLGWQLNLDSTSGTPSVRVRKDLPPQDGAVGQSSFITGSALIVPPFLTNGVWYVEVKGGGSTTFTLTSRGFTTNSLSRTPWVMPAITQTNVAPGLTLPEIGDSGTDANGNPLPGDRGVDLSNGTFHYYAVVVPTNNAGLLRTELDAISGNPNLYLRQTNAPTLSHNSDGNPGSIYDRALGGTTTTYGNWAPIAGRYESALPPGTWIIAVHAAGGSNCRYRLRLSCGNPVTNGLVQNLALNGGTVTNQNLAGGDWRYYRIAIPSNAPANLAVTFTRSLGSARLFVRDTTPPGDQGANLDYDNIFYLNSAATWTTDNKNQGPYPRFDSPGTINLSTPPLRPGANYFLGVWSVNDTTFSLSTSTNGGVIVVTNIIPFYGGFLTNTLPANGTLLARVNVPADAARWRSSAVHPGSVNILLEQGTVPGLVSQHYNSGGGGNSSIDQYLLNPNGWPWVLSQSYFILFTNTTASPVPISFTMDGRNLVTDDEDNDGLPDAWELVYFDGTGYTGASDPDGDGLSNSQEYLLGTNPNNGNTVPHLSITPVGGNLFDIVFSGETGLTYRVQYSANLSAWSNLFIVPLTNSPKTITDSPPMGTTNRFYRVIFP